MYLLFTKSKYWFSDLICSITKEQVSHVAIYDEEDGVVYHSNFYGVNRISVGVQTFNNEDLKRLGRTHTAEDAINSINILKKYVTNYNIDLIFAYPEHKFEMWESTLKQALSLNPPHITTYYYRNMPNTVFNMLQKKGLKFCIHRCIISFFNQCLLH